MDVSSSDVLTINIARWKSPVSEVLVRLVDFVPGAANGLSLDFGLAEPVSDVVLRFAVRWLYGCSEAAPGLLRGCLCWGCSVVDLWLRCSCSVVAP